MAVRNCSQVSENKAFLDPAGLVKSDSFLREEASFLLVGSSCGGSKKPAE
jgi:hypothetical protein